MKQYFIVKANYQTKNGNCVIEVLDDGDNIVQLFAYPCDDKQAERQAYREANEYVTLLKGYE